ncbi:MAG TPA: UDP-glucose 4-epimerase GalE [Firmicutes bacterium]|nr:UDP-glucose 4-epimerase GalE [Candidatus Fermentithermobacillaceae bacterium]
MLVTGGAGYIGAHTVKALSEAGYHVTVFDDLSRGHPEHIPGIPLIIGLMEDEDALRDVFASYEFDAVIHFAGESQAGESVLKPDKYFRRNVIGGLNLCSAMVRKGVSKLVFSSSAAVYGDPEEIPISEQSPVRPKSPYGESKAFLERALAWYDRAYGLKSVSLRYFNAAGADPGCSMGEEHEPETHLIPLVFRAISAQTPLTVFGDDYPTPDGTAIRDYVHVTDLAGAHVLALDFLGKNQDSLVLNLGSGKGYSVLEIIKEAERVTGKKVPYVLGRRRQGDPAVLVASSGKAVEMLGWRPRLSSLEDIISTAWAWHVKSSMR